MQNIEEFMKGFIDMKEPEISLERCFFTGKCRLQCVHISLELSKTTLILGSHILVLPEM